MADAVTHPFFEKDGGHPDAGKAFVRLVEATIQEKFRVKRGLPTTLLDEIYEGRAGVSFKLFDALQQDFYAGEPNSQDRKDLAALRKGESVERFAVEKKAASPIGADAGRVDSPGKLSAERIEAERIEAERIEVSEAEALGAVGFGFSGGWNVGVYNPLTIELEAAKNTAAGLLAEKSAMEEEVQRLKTSLSEVGRASAPSFELDSNPIDSLSDDPALQQFLYGNLLRVHEELGVTKKVIAEWFGRTPSGFFEALGKGTCTLGLPALARFASQRRCSLVAMWRLCSEELCEDDLRILLKLELTNA